MSPFTSVASVLPASPAREGAGKAAPGAPQGRFEEALAEATPPAGPRPSRAGPQAEASRAAAQAEPSRAEQTDAAGATAESSTERPARPKHRARADADVSVLLDLYRALVPPAPKPVAARTAGPAASVPPAVAGAEPRAQVRAGEADVKPQQQTGVVDRRAAASGFAIRAHESRPRPGAASEEPAPSTGARTAGLELTTLRGEPAPVAAVTAPPAALAMLELHQGETAVRGAIDAQHAQLSMRVGGEELSVLLRLHGSIADVRVTGALPSQLAPGVAEDALRAALAGTGLTAGVLEVRPPPASASSQGAGSSDHRSPEDGTDPEHRSPERQPDGDA